MWELTQATSTDKLTDAVLAAVVTVAKCFLQEKAILLSSACTVFLKAYSNEINITSNISSVELYLENRDGTTTKFTSCWLLHQLILHLRHHLSFKCVHKRYGGTVLYKTNGDILTSLSWALGD